MLSLVSGFHLLSHPINKSEICSLSTIQSFLTTAIAQAIIISSLAYAIEKITPRILKTADVIARIISSNFYFLIDGIVES